MPRMPSRSPARKPITRTKRLVFGSVVLAILALIAEGAAQLILLLNYGPRPTVSERLIEYDAYIGWRNIPNHAAKHRYGQGKHATHGPRGLRGGKEHSLERRDGSYRVLCLGDSFTYGVCGDDETYPSVLQSRHRKLEVLNMGVLGHGLDQTYLLYKRYGTQYDVDLVLLAFIDDDLTRMERSTFLVRNPKPQLVLHQTELAPTNVPVPTWGDASARGWMAGLPTSSALFQLSYTILDRLGSHQSAELIAERIFTEMHEDARRRRRQFVVVYLPSDYAGCTDLQASGPPARIDRLERFAAKHGIAFLNLTEEFKSSCLGTGRQWFQSNGHYTADANQVVADLLSAALRTVDPAFPAS